MTYAACRCSRGHTFTSRVVEDSPDINYFEVADSCCPECGSEEFVVPEVEYDDPDD